MIAKERHLARAYRRPTIREISRVLRTSASFRTIFFQKILARDVRQRS